MRNATKAKWAKDAVEKWNAAHGGRTPVTLLRDSGERLATWTRTPAFVCASGDAVIFLEGVTGYYLLSRCTARGA